MILQVMGPSVIDPPDTHFKDRAIAINNPALKAAET
ncbi:MAG: hypothetical protein ACJA2Q_002111 [Pseudohongiellaceae bacterium]|jgi:hypothetical protein